VSLTVSTVVGGIHGAIFLGYGVITVLAGGNQRCKPQAIIGGAFLALVPYATLSFEINRNRKGLLVGGWPALLVVVLLASYTRITSTPAIVNSSRMF
jgi:hypothetical protein